MGVQNGERIDVRDADITTYGNMIIINNQRGRQMNDKELFEARANT